MVRVKLPKPPVKRGRKPLEILTIEKPDIKDKERFLEYVKMRIIQFYDKGLDYSIYRIAEEFNVCPKTVKNYLRKYGIKYAEFKIQVINEYLKQKEESRKKLEELKTIAKLPVESRKDFYNREIVKELMKRLDDQIKLGKLSISQRNAILSVYYKLVIFTKLPPEFFIESDRKSVYDKVREFLTYYASIGKNVNTIVSQIQSLQNWLGINILPPEIKQEEYTGKFNQVYINKIMRDRIIELILNDLQKKTIEIEQNGKKITFTKKQIIDTTKVMIFLFYTGSRREAIKNHTVTGRIRLDSMIVNNVYNENEFYVIKTAEKGKRGRKLMWDKLIPMSYKFCLENLKDVDLNKTAIIMKHYITKAFEEFKTKYKDNIEYSESIKQIELYLKHGKVYHIWRHTSAHEFLRAFNYNMLIVSKLLGWKKSDNLKIYADPTIYQLLNVRSEYSKVEFCSKELYEKIIQIIQV